MHFAVVEGPTCRTGLSQKQQVAILARLIISGMLHLQVATPPLLDGRPPPASHRQEPAAVHGTHLQLPVRGHIRRSSYIAAWRTSCCPQHDRVGIQIEHA